jgi:hypothetical protein
METGRGSSQSLINYFMVVFLGYGRRLTKVNKNFINGNIFVQFFSRLKPLLIPWERINGLREGSLHWKKTVILSIGDPEIGTVTVFEDLYKKIGPFHRPEIHPPPNP